MAAPKSSPAQGLPYTSTQCSQEPRVEPSLRLQQTKRAVATGASSTATMDRKTQPSQVNSLSLPLGPDKKMGTAQFLPS